MRIFTIILDFIYITSVFFYLWILKKYILDLIKIFTSIETIPFMEHIFVFFVSCVWIILGYLLYKLNKRVF
jgi:hypothetical protein